MSNPSPAFDRLISPVGAEEFFSDYWERQPIHLRREAADYYDCALTVNSVDDYLQIQQLSPDYLAVLKGGDFCPPEEWTQSFQRIRNNTTQRVVDVKKLLALFDSGATIIINSGELAIPSLTDLCRSLEHELKCPVQANVYITPPESQGFAPHFDAHNVFILQIHGRKTWNLYDIPMASPVRTTPVESFRYHEREPERIIELSPGDLLYVPRGMVHSARSEKNTSIHVTIGPMVRHWSSLLKTLAKKADENENFRRLLPNGLSSEREQSEFALEFARELQKLLARTDLLGVHYANFVDERRTDNRGLFTDLLRLEQLTPDSVVCRRPDLDCSVERTNEWIIIRFEGEELILPLFLNSAVVKIFEVKPFAVREIQGIPNEAGKLAIVKRFVKAGFLTVISI